VIQAIVRRILVLVQPTESSATHRVLPGFTQRRAAQWLTALAFGVSAVATAGCDGKPSTTSLPPIGDTPATEAHGPRSSEYSIKMYVTDETGKTELVKVGPYLSAEGDPADTTASDQSSNGSTTSIGQSRQALTLQECDDEGENCENPVTENPTVAPADLLLKYAYQSCRVAYLPQWDTPWLRKPAGSGEVENWYVFGGKARSWNSSGDQTKSNGWRSCDEILVGEEILVCTADRLAEVADSITTLTWPISINNTIVKVPPQASQDKFIARDLAVNVLAHLVDLDTITPLSDSSYYSADTLLSNLGCNRAYREVADGELTGTDSVNKVFDIYYSSPTLAYLTDTLDNGDESLSNAEKALSRIAYKARILEAGARLLQGLIEKSMEADLGGAEQLRIFPAQMWGQESKDGFNTLEHGLKTLFGRVEARRNKDSSVQSRLEDPECNGVASWDLVEALGPGFSARWETRAPTSPGQSLALSTVAKSGIMIPLTSLESASEANLRLALKETLVRQGAASDDEEAIDAFRDSLIGKASADIVDSLSLDDLRFGFTEAFHTYRLIADRPADDDEIVATAGLTLKPSGEIHSAITDLDGAVIQGGLPRSDLAGDMLAKLSGAQATSQCASNAANLWYTSQARTTIYQSPFALADTIQARIAEIGPLLEGVSGVSSIQEMTALSAAEIRSWSGEAVVVHGWGDFNAGSGTAICPGPDLIGRSDYCSPECPCSQGEGSCGVDADCDSGLICMKDRGNWWGYRDTYGVCVSPTCSDWIDTAPSTNKPGHASFCTNCKCAAGKGDCGNTTSRCMDGLTCVANVGNKFGYSNSSVDVCLPSGYDHSECPNRHTTGWWPNSEYCTPDCQCLKGEGDADSGDCQGNLELVDDVGERYGLPTDYDICEPGHTSDEQTFILSGLKPQTFGVSTHEQMLDKLTIVYGESWMAECVAGIRQACPEDLGTISGLSRFDLTTSNTELSEVGYDGRPAPTLIVTLDFVPPSGANKRYFIVALEDTHTGNGTGRILASMVRGNRGERQREIISEYRRELLDDVFGMGAAARNTPTCVDTGLSSLPSSYCIPGMERDMFVPLANELTSDSTEGEDSWEHYLGLAEQAAQDADELGRQMLEVGKEKLRFVYDEDVFAYNRAVTLATRKEAAQEQLAELCGTFVDESGSDITFAADGTPIINPNNAALAACLGTDVTDLVFLGKDPFEGVSEIANCESKSGIAGGSCAGSQTTTSKTQDELIEETFCQPPTDPNRQPPAFCRDLDLSDEEDPVPKIDKKSLNIPGIPSPPSMTLDTCEAAIKALPMNHLGGSIDDYDATHLVNNAWQSWGTPAGIGAALGNLRYVHDANGAWGVTLYGRPLLANESYLDTYFPPNSNVPEEQQLCHRRIYPACLDQIGGCSCNHGGLACDQQDNQDRSCTAVAMARAFPDEDDDGYHTKVRMKVERALWHMGAIAGGIPNGVFSFGVPVANLGDTDGPAAAVYSPGEFRETLTEGYYELDEDPRYPPYSRQSLGWAVPMSEEYAARMTFTKKPWLYDLYWNAFTTINGGDPEEIPYLLSWSWNDLIKFNPGFYTFGIEGSWDDPPDEVDNTLLTSRGAFTTWLQDMAARVNQTSCGNGTHIRESVLSLSAWTPTPRNSPPFNQRNENDAMDVKVRDWYTAREVCGGRNVEGQDVDRVFIEYGPYKSATQGPQLEARFSGITDSKRPIQLMIPNVAANGLEGELDFPFDLPCDQDDLYLRLECDVGFNFGNILSTNPLDHLPGSLGGSWFDEDCTPVSNYDRHFGCLSMTGSEVPSSDDIDPEEPTCDVELMTSDCLPSRSAEGSVTQPARHFFAGRQLRADVCTKFQRAELFIERAIPNDCEALQSITQAMTLACVAQKSAGRGVLEPPPAVRNMTELLQLQLWVTQTEDTVARAASELFLQRIPTPVVDDFRSEAIDTSAIGQGKNGALMLSLQASIEGIANAWQNVVLATTQIRTAIDGAVARLNLNELEAEAQLANIDLSRVEVNRRDSIRAIQGAHAGIQMMLGMASAGAQAGGIMSNYMAGAAAMADMALIADRFQEASEIRATDSMFDSQLTGILDRLSANAEDQNAAKDLIALIDLNKETLTGQKNINDALHQMRSQTLILYGLLNQLELNRKKAAWQLRKIKGLDFVTFDGEETAQEINNVLARQYDGLRLRYERALERAKRAAYVARLAIEQRLGVRFATMDEPVGPLPPPSTWIEDVCSLQGIDYNSLKAELGPDNPNGTPVDPIVDDITTQFADSFIGDYVAQLREMVEFYNVEFPFHQSEDIAVLSLKDDLLHAGDSCTESAKNLLFHSHELFEGEELNPEDKIATPVEDYVSSRGWRLHRCSEDSCLDVQSGSVMATLASESPESVDFSGPGGHGGASWLKRHAESNGLATPLDPSPEESIYQSVTLSAGQEYVLSWWDMSRASNGGIPDTDELSSYSATIYDSSWRIVAGETLEGVYPGTSGQEWSPRREVHFTSPDDSTFHVAFSVNTAAGSVALGNLQLEVSASPTAYVAVTDKRLVVSDECQGNTDLSKFFRYTCEGGRVDQGTAESCYWELNQLIRLDMESLNNGFGPLVGKVGVGNYNHRLLTSAVNVVGTGVIDCTSNPTASCFGSGYLEYDLQHAAFRIPMQDHSGEVTCFDFGNAAVRGGKALASERFITLPIGSADMELIQQPAFTKTELAGRPLSGQYKLRIKDNPSLSWDKVEDIQLVLGYGYWSGINPVRN
jgi:hypothetical protein